MADTWMTPTRKADLLSYIDSLKQMSGNPVEEEDLYAAGFSEKDLDEIGWFKPAPKASAMAGDGSKLEPYEPTSRDNLRTNVSGGLQGLGLDKQLARSVAVKIAGEENPTDGGLGMGLADFTPFGALFGAEEGVNAVKRGVNSGDYTTAGLGALNAAASVASALPGGKAVSQGINKLAEKLSGQFDPNVVRTFFGPTSVKADLGKLATAKQLTAGGADEQTVWQETGWWNGPNGWRFEVDDSKMQLPEDSHKKDMFGITYSVVKNDGYFKALKANPDLPEDELPTGDFFEHERKRQQVENGYTDLGPMDAGKWAKGEFNSDNAGMKAYGYDPEDQKETLVHEMQHAIQYVFGDKGTGTNPRWVAKRLKDTLDEMPYDLQNAAGGAAELGYSSVRLDRIETFISSLEARVAKKAALNEEALASSVQKSGEIPFGWGKADTSTSDKELLEALYKEREALSEKIKDYSWYINSVEKAYPEFSQAVGEFKILGQGIGEQFFVANPNFTESILSKKYVFKTNGELEDFAAHTLYSLDAGEVEARVAGDRASWFSEERAFYPPATDVISKDYIYNQGDFNNWLSGVGEDAKKRKGYAKGGVVQELDPISGNEVPPGAEPKEVRDDVDAKLSDGEYVIPADVVRYLGLDKIEKLVAQAKEGLAEMDANGRIGGEEVPVEDDLPFTDEELMSGEPLQMAGGGFVDTTTAPTPTVKSPGLRPWRTPELPSWMRSPDLGTDPITPVQAPAPVVTGQVANRNTADYQPAPRQESWADRQSTKTPMGMSGAVETWKADDFSKAVRQRNDPGARAGEQLVKMIPLGGLMLGARHKYLDKKVPGAIDSMIASGKDVDGTPLTDKQIADLQKAKTDFVATKGYKPTGALGLAVDAVKSVIKPRDKQKTEDRPSVSTKSTQSGGTSKPATRPSSSTSSKSSKESNNSSKSSGTSKPSSSKGSTSTSPSRSGPVSRSSSASKPSGKTSSSKSSSTSSRSSSSSSRGGSAGPR